MTPEQIRMIIREELSRMLWQATVGFIAGYFIVALIGKVFK